MLANSPPFVRAMREADAALEAGRVRPASEAFAELGEEGGNGPAATEREHRRVGPLTARELEVITLLVQGRTARGIAQELGISPRAARNHIARILDKLAVSARATAGSL